jgi:hyperosmotically inducible protein
MTRTLSAALLAVALASPAVWAQDGPLRRAGRALDNAGKNVRDRVETEVARGQVSAAERDLLNRVTLRLSWDKQLANSALRLEVQVDGTAVLRGSVLSDAAKRRAVDLVENTVGVTRVVDELAVVKDVKVIQAPPAGAIISTPVTEGVETKVIVKP